MSSTSPTPIVGNAVVICIDAQKGFFSTGMPSPPRNTAMSDILARVDNIRTVVDGAREHGVRVIFVQEFHKPDRRVIGRELDGFEEMYCVERCKRHRTCRRSQTSTRRISHPQASILGFLWNRT